MHTCIFWSVYFLIRVPFDMYKYAQQIRKLCRSSCPSDLYPFLQQSRHLRGTHGCRDCSITLSAIFINSVLSSHEEIVKVQSLNSKLTFCNPYRISNNTSDLSIDWKSLTQKCLKEGKMTENKSRISSSSICIIAIMCYVIIQLLYWRTYRIFWWHLHIHYLTVPQQHFFSYFCQAIVLFSQREEICTPDW